MARLVVGERDIESQCMLSTPQWPRAAAAMRSMLGGAEDNVRARLGPAQNRRQGNEKNWGLRGVVWVGSGAKALSGSK
jgi:hypothetical protein